MGSWSSELVMMFIHTVLVTHDQENVTADWNFHSLKISHNGDLGCSAELNSFCSWFYSVYYHSRSGKMDKAH